MKELNEIYFIRPIIILLLVVYHSFIIYSGGWEMPAGIHDCASYYWIAKVSYSFMLEMFTFISGYLFALSFSKKRMAFKTLFIKKGKRLLVPSVLFSIIYAFMYSDYEFLSLEYIYRIAEGVGHMWYLPMLFWCFVFSYFIIKVRIGDNYKLFGLLLIVPFSVLPLPFRIATACYYLFFFYLGYVISMNKERIKQFINIRNTIIVSLLFLVAFVVSTMFLEELHVNRAHTLIEKAFFLLLFKYCKIVYVLLGMFSLYSVSIIYTSHNRMTDRIKELNKYCFGIYLIQQFVLIYFYRYTDMPVSLGTYILPWISCILTLIISYILSYLIYKTRVGRNLI